MLLCSYFVQDMEIQLSPLCVQAESALDQMDWIEKITGVIASLLSSQAPERVTYIRQIWQYF